MRVVLYGITLLLLLGCQSSPKDMYADMYLRSEFTWWEARPEFKFKTIQESTNKQVTAKIEADGNPYHLKIADRAWSQNKNCGYNNVKDKVVTLDSWIELSCTYNFEKLNATPIQKPFEFKPTVSGTYKFSLKMTLQGPSHLMISKQ